MARPLRFQCAGASYHLMARGDGGKAVFGEHDGFNRPRNPTHSDPDDFGQSPGCFESLPPNVNS